MKEQLTQYIATVLLEEADATVEAGDDLLTTGLLDSLKIMQLIAHVETSAGLKIPPEDMTIDHFISVDAIHNYLETRKS